MVMKFMKLNVFIWVVGTCYLVIGMSLCELYVRQPKLRELWRFIEKTIFEMLDHEFELRSPIAPYERVQFDAIFKT